ncbi:MAG: glycosyltransferase family protein [Bacteroidota bacterium]
MKNVLCIIQARMSSTRLPGKVLLPLGGRPVIEQVFHQLSFSKRIKKISVATSTDRSDDELERWATRLKYLCYRGSLDNVLERYYRAAQQNNADVVVRVTADCPLIDPEVADAVIDGFLQGTFDYYSNVNPPTFPDGLDVEVFSFAALKSAFENARLKSETEHVTPYIRNHPEMFPAGNFRNERNFESHRWTLDTREDYEFLKIIFGALSKPGQPIRWMDTIRFLERNPNVRSINEHIERNEGYKKSLKEDGAQYT